MMADAETGRPNQKSRTRKDLLQAASRLMKEGRRPSLEEVAEAALVSRATAYRYRDEGVKALAEQAPDLHEELEQVAEQGWSHVVLDGTVIRSDRCAETTTSVPLRFA